MIQDALVCSGLLLGFLQVKPDLGNAQDAMQRMTARLPEDDSAATAALLARCAKADAPAFRELYDLRSAKLHGVALRITRNATLAADAVHDAFLQVWRNAASFDPERGNADAWLLSLVRYRALDSIRRSSRELTGIDVPEQVDADPDALSRLVASSEGTQLRACLEQVDTPRRNLIVLAFIEGLSQTEVAARVSQPLGTVKSTIRRTLLALRTCLQPGADSVGARP